MSKGVAAEKVIVMRPRTEDGEDGELGLSEREPWQRAAGEAKAMKMSPEGYVECEKDADSEKGSSGHGVVKNNGPSPVSKSVVLKKELQELHKVPDAKKASLRKTCPTQTETNNRVRTLSENTKKAVAQLAKIYK